jgi:hypothetical protein
MPEVPNLPTGEVSQFVKTIGGQIVGALNTNMGRAMVAELLVYVAGSLTKAAVNTEAGRDAKDALVNASAKIGAAAANAGAKFVETGAQAASSGAEAASDAAGGAKSLAREVAQVAVSTVGGVVAEAATKVLKGRGGRKSADQGGGTGQGTPGGAGASGEAGGSGPSAARPGTPRPPQL